MAQLDTSPYLTTKQRNADLTRSVENNLKRFEVNKEGVPTSPKDYYYNLSPKDQQAVIDEFAKALQLPQGEAKMMTFDKSFLLAKDQEDIGMSISLYSGSSKKIAFVDYNLVKKELASVYIKEELAKPKREEERREAVLGFAGVQGLRLAGLAQEQKGGDLISEAKGESYLKTNSLKSDVAENLIKEMIAAYKLDVNPADVVLKIKNSSYVGKDGANKGELVVFLKHKDNDALLAMLHIDRRGNDRIVDFNK